MAAVKNQQNFWLCCKIRLRVKERVVKSFAGAAQLPLLWKNREDGKGFCFGLIQEAPISHLVGTSPPEKTTK